MSYPSVTNTFVAGTVLASAEMNTNFSDIITALSSGANEINVASIYVGNGLVGTPSITFANDLDTGIWLSSANTFNISTGGTERLELSSAGIKIGNAYTFPLTDGTANQVLVTDGSGSVTWTDQTGGISNIVEDTTPQLGGDLDVNGNAIVSASDGNIAITPNGTGSIVLDGLSWPQADGTNGQVLTTNGSAQLSWTDQSGGGLSDVVDDTTPQLGGDLDVNGNSIVSVSNGNIPITPNGTGSIVLDGLSWPQADGTANQVLSTNGSGQLSFATVSGGDVISSANLTDNAILKGDGGSKGIQTSGITINDSNDISGANVLRIGNGTAGNPSFSFNSDTNTGFYLSSFDTLDIVTGGYRRVSISSSIITCFDMLLHAGNGTAGNPSFSFVDDNNTGMWRSGADILNFSTGGTERLELSSSGIRIGDTYVLPLTDGTNGQVLVTNGSGSISWTDQSGGGLSDVVDDTTPQLGGNLDVNGNSIVSVSNGNIPITPNGTGNLILDGLNWPQADGTNGQVLTTNGSAQLSWTDQSGGGLSDVVDDTTPQLGGDLDVNGNSIVSVSNGNIPITPNGTGSIVLDGLSWPQADGTANQVLSTNGSGQLSFATVSGGGSAIPSYNINYITNHSAYTDVTGWTGVGDLDVARSNTASELPRENTLATGIKITADANTQSTADYIYYDFTLDDVDLSQDLKLCWSQKTTGTYNAGDLAVIITTQADRTTSSIMPAITAIPASDGVFKTTFRASTTATLSLVIRATTDMSENGGIVISDVCITPYGKIKRTKHVGNTVLNATSNVSNNALTATYLDGYAWCDSDNKWWFKFNLQGEFEESLTNGSIGMTGITAARTYSPLDGVDTGSYFVQNAAISFSKWSGTSYLSLAGEFPLTTEPSWAKDYLDY